MKFLINKFSISVVVVVALAIGGWTYFSGSEESQYDTVVVQRQDVVQDISTTGRVVAVRNVDLAFEKSGRVSRVYVDIGDRVRAGDPLVALSNSEESAQLAQARARLSKDRIRLEELLVGARPEEIEVQEVKVRNAERALTDSKRALVDTLQDTYTKADDAVRNKVDQLFTNPRTSNPKLNSAFSFSPFRSDVELERIRIEATLENWLVSLGALTTTSDLDTYSNSADQNLTQVKNLLDKLGLMVNGLTPDSSLTQATIDIWKTAVSTGRTNINTTITALSASREKLENANSALALSKEELILKKSGATAEQINSQEAQIREAEANVSFFQAQLAKLTLYSPISGIVTEQDAKVGMLTSPSSVVVSVISEGKYQIEAFVVEADIANLNLGDVATLSLDAYGEDITFLATVVKINPGADLQEGVANYKTTLEFKENSDKIRAGMTADIDIVTARRDGVLAIPERAIIFRDSMKIVRVLLPDQSVNEVEVSTGITGGRGLIEVTNGLNEGDVVITGTKK